MADDILWACYFYPADGAQTTASKICVRICQGNARDSRACMRVKYGLFLGPIILKVVKVELDS